MTDALVHQSRLADLINESVKSNGFSDGLRPCLRHALSACPRHLFVGRYRPFFLGPVHSFSEGDLGEHLSVIYSDTALGQVDETGRNLPSTNSRPSFVLRLLELLDLKPGQRVLEIGSGSGWLLGLIARAIGGAGHATGIEILAALAERSRRSLAAAGITNATVVAADGASGYLSGAPYDRVILTAGLWELPTAFFDQIQIGGLMLAPFQIKGPGEDVLLLRRTEYGFRAEAALSAFFVPMAGRANSDEGAPVSLESIPLWRRLRNRSALRIRVPFGGGSAEEFAQRTAGFRSYLTKVEPRFFVFGIEMPNAPRAAGMAGFGLVDADAESLALCTPGDLEGFGNPRATQALLAAYADWTDMMMPNAEAFETQVLPSVPKGLPPEIFVERRGGATFLRALKSDWQRASQFAGNSL